MKTQISACSKIKYQKHTFEHKLFVKSKMVRFQLTTHPKSMIFQDHPLITGLKNMLLLLKKTKQ